MKAHILNMPEDPAELVDWLEQHLLGLHLGELVTELSEVHGAKNRPQQSLDELLTETLPEILRRGLSAASLAQLRLLLTTPTLLLDLQERILIEGSDYWSNPAKTPPEITHRVSEQWQRLEKLLTTEPVANSDSFSAETVELASRKAWWQCSWVFGLVAAASVLLAVTLRMRPSQQPLSDAWGWNRPGTFAADVTADAYLDRLEDRANEWSRRPHDTPQRLQEDLLEFRRACVALLAETHDRLPPDQRRELKKRCQKWLGDIDGHLAALNRGESVLDVQKAADETVRKLTTAIHRRFPA